MGKAHIVGKVPGPPRLLSGLGKLNGPTTLSKSHESVSVPFAPVFAAPPIDPGSEFRKVHWQSIPVSRFEKSIFNIKIFGNNFSKNIDFEIIKKNYAVYYGDSSGAAFYALHRMVVVALRARVRYMIHWQIYDNDLRMGGKYEGKGLSPGVMATPEQCVGNWLIRPDGSRVPTYDYFKSLFDSEKAEFQR
jgi:hypothetical protein